MKQPKQPTQMQENNNSSAKNHTWLYISLFLFLVLLLGAGATIGGVFAGLALATRQDGSQAASAASPPTSTPALTVQPTTSPKQEFKCFESQSELYDAVDAYLADKSSSSDVAATYGWPINNWCVYRIIKGHSSSIAKP